MRMWFSVLRRRRKKEEEDVQSTYYETPRPIMCFGVSKERPLLPACPNQGFFFLVQALRRGESGHTSHAKHRVDLVAVFL